MATGANVLVAAATPVGLAGWSGAVRAVGQLVRPMTTVLVLVQGWFVLALLGGTGVPQPRAGVPVAVTVAAAVVALCCWYAHAVAVNDLTDVDVDRLNLRGTADERERPLVNGTTGRGQLVVLQVVLVVGLVAATLLTDRRLLLAVPAMLALNYAYSVRPLRLTARGGWAQAVLPLGYVGVPAVYAWALSGWARPSTAALVTVGGLGVLFAGRLMLKDVRDVRGDTAVGKRTFLVRHGLAVTIRVTGVLLGIGGLVMLGGAAAASPVRGAVLAVVLGAAAVGVVWTLRRLEREADLAVRVRLVAVVGRLCTGWLFCSLLAAVVPASTSWLGFVALVALGAVTFGVSVRLVLDAPHP